MRAEAGQQARLVRGQLHRQLRWSVPGHQCVCGESHDGKATAAAVMAQRMDLPTCLRSRMPCIVPRAAQSLFEVPDAEAEPIEYEISRVTEIFRRLLRDKFGLEEAPGLGEGTGISIDFENMLSERLEGYVTRRDAGLSFLQLLVLKSLDVIDVTQKKPFGDICINKGPKWDTTFSNFSEVGA